MKIRYDDSVDAAYISFADPEEVSTFGFACACDSEEIGGQIHLNFDVSGRLMGLEILQASKRLPRNMLGNFSFSKMVE